MKKPKIKLKNNRPSMWLPKPNALFTYNGGGLKIIINDEMHIFAANETKPAFWKMKIREHDIKFTYVNYYFISYI